MQNVTLFEPLSAHSSELGRTKEVAADVESLQEWATDSEPVPRTIAASIRLRLESLPTESDRGPGLTSHCRCRSERLQSRLTHDPHRARQPSPEDPMFPVTEA